MMLVNLIKSASVTDISEGISPGNILNNSNSQLKLFNGIILRFYIQYLNNIIIFYSHFN